MFRFLNTKQAKLYNEVVLADTASAYERHLPEELSWEDWRQTAFDYLKGVLLAAGEVIFTDPDLENAFFMRGCYVDECLEEDERTLKYFWAGYEDIPLEDEYEILFHVRGTADECRKLVDAVWNRFEQGAWKNAGFCEKPEFNDRRQYELTCYKYADGGVELFAHPYLPVLRRVEQPRGVVSRQTDLLVLANRTLHELAEKMAEFTRTDGGNVDIRFGGDRLDDIIRSLARKSIAHAVALKVAVEAAYWWANPDEIVGSEVKVLPEVPVEAVTKWHETKKNLFRPVKMHWVKENPYAPCTVSLFDAEPDFDEDADAELFES